MTNRIILLYHTTEYRFLYMIQVFKDCLDSTEIYLFVLPHMYNTKLYGSGIHYLVNIFPVLLAS